MKIVRVGLIFATIIGWNTASAQEIDDDCYLCAEANAIIEEYSLRESSTQAREREDWAPPNRIVIGFGGGGGLADLLKRVAPDAEIIAAGSPEAAAEFIEGADVYFGICTPEIAKRGTSLKWIQIMRAGIDSCARYPEIAERGTVATNLQRVLAKPIAEHAISLMFAFSRKLYAFRDEQITGQWTGDIREGRRTFQAGLWEVNERTMLVVGLGGIGSEVARLAHALGMRVLATRNSRREGPDFVEYVGLSHEMNELAAQADVVVSTLPLTDGTANLHNAAFFEAMTPEAIFINVGRGATVDTDALVAALQSGAIAGAGLDVAYPEPLPDGHPLWTLPNVMMTPHVAGSNAGRNRTRIGPLLVENMRRYVAGDALISEVDLARGY
jgi:phosphoglycerate dehydrogenase-like enzyme